MKTFFNYAIYFPSSKATSMSPVILFEVHAYDILENACDKQQLKALASKISQLTP